MGKSTFPVISQDSKSSVCCFWQKTNAALIAQGGAELLKYSKSCRFLSLQQHATGGRFSPYRNTEEVSALRQIAQFKLLT